MDFTIVGGLLTVLLTAIPAAGAYFQRQTRRIRRENRLLRNVAQEADLHIFALERLLSSRGIRPPARPELLRAVAGDDTDDTPAARPPAAAPDSEAGSGARHTAP